MQPPDGFEPAPGRKRAVTIGVFDGIHQGHQGVLRDLLARAAQEDLEPLALTFNTHPESILTPQPPPALITLEHRLRLMADLGLEQVLVLPFDSELQAMTPARFADRILVERLQTGLLVMGYDSTLGRNREGDFSTMTQLGRSRDFRVVTSPPLLWQGAPISSSHIRRALRRGDLGLVWGLLGRPFSHLGTVVRGRGQGRNLGIPTANLDPEGCLMPPPGVYAASARVAGKSWPAVLNLGTHPTFPGGKAVIETHLLDFPDRDLYGLEMEVAFHRRIREERKFPGPEELVAQVQEDLATCRKILGDSQAAGY